MLHNRLRRRVLKSQNWPAIISLAIAGGFLIWQYGNFTGGRETNPPDAAGYVLSQMELCRAGGSDPSCYDEAAGSLLRQFGVTQILEVLKMAREKGEDVPDCHVFSHFLGRREYHRLGSVSKVFEECLFVCTNGCFHGAIEGYFEKKQKESPLNMNDELLGGEVKKICGSPSDYPTRYGYDECLHGIGHALMFLTEMNLPRSLKLCDVLAIVEEKEQCYSGIFMENAAALNNEEHPSRFIKSDDPMYPCSILEKRYLDQCYTWQVLDVFPHLVATLEERIGLCETAFSESREACFKALGRSVGGSSGDSRYIKETCGLMPEKKFREACVKGAVSGWTFSDFDDSRLAGFCSILDEELKPACYNRLGVIWSWGRGVEKGQAACRRLPDQNSINWCLEGAAGNASK